MNNGFGENKAADALSWRLKAQFRSASLYTTPMKYRGHTTVPRAAGFRVSRRQLLLEALNP